MNKGDLVIYKKGLYTITSILNNVCTINSIKIVSSHFEYTALIVPLENLKLASKAAQILFME